MLLATVFAGNKTYLIPDSVSFTKHPLFDDIHMRPPHRLVTAGGSLSRPQCLEGTGV